MTDAGGTCLACDPPQRVASILDHLRLFHPDQYGDGPECWPDGSFVITVSPEDMDAAWREP